MPQPLQQAENWLAEHGDAMLAYALRRVNSQAVAEDVVQEALLAALKGADSFRGQSTVRTWLIGILRFKIVDHFRRAARESPAAGGDGGDWPFDEQHHWRQRPGDWGRDPAQLAESDEFRAALAACINHLPATLRPALQFRVLDELKTAEICSMLEITPTNLSVRLARARVLLRECLERNWFAGDA